MQLIFINLSDLLQPIKDQYSKLLVYDAANKHLLKDMSRLIQKGCKGNAWGRLSSGGRAVVL